MRRNYRSSMQQQRQKVGRLDRDDYEADERKTEGQLKSLECSSVQQIHPTNQSYEMSWLEKLVNNIDEQKPTYNKSEQVSRNFSKKYSYQNQSIGQPYEKPTRSYMETIKQFSSAKSLSHSPISRLNQKKQTGVQSYQVSKFRTNQNQRIEQNTKTIPEKYEYGRPYSRNAVADRQNNKETDLQENSISYGKIKRINKTKDHNAVQEYKRTQSKPNLQKIQISMRRPYQSAQKRQRQRFVTEAQPRQSLYNHHQYKNSGPFMRQSRNKTSGLTSEESSALKRRVSDYSSYKDRKYNMPDYAKISQNYKKQLTCQSSSAQPISMESKYDSKYDSKYSKYQMSQEKQPSKSKEKDIQVRKKEKQQDVKMDEMAKKLNLVLQNINKKSKLISQNPCSDQSKKASTFDSSNYQVPGQTQIATPMQQSSIPSYSKLNYSNYPSIVVKPPAREEVARKQSLTESELRQKYNNFVDEELRKKHHNMKKSLGMSKHIPSQIILEESSSQINSEISPRTQFLNRQFRLIFDTLDKNNLGELSKNNCALELIHDEIKYLFGGIFSKIKYKNERIIYKYFVQQCQHIVKQFQLQELKQVLNKTKQGKETIHFRLAQKQTESQRWNTQTNNQSQSKRSSGRSEVVKKYQFGQNQDFDEFKSIQKVHWIAPQYKNPEKLKQHNENDRNLSKSPYLNKAQDSILKIKPQYKKSQNSPFKKQMRNTYIQAERKTQIENFKEKQNIGRIAYSAPKQRKQQKKDFEKMCENLNNKLNNYLTTITKKQQLGPKIPLQFSELSKHWSISRS